MAGPVGIEGAGAPEAAGALGDWAIVGIDKVAAISALAVTVSRDLRLVRMCSGCRYEDGRCRRRLASGEDDGGLVTGMYDGMTPEARSRP